MNIKSGPSQHHRASVRDRELSGFLLQNRGSEVSSAISQRLSGSFSGDMMSSLRSLSKADSARGPVQDRCPVDS